eukprot:1186702-Prorocentrum_minimum.AAC.1
MAALGSRQVRVLHVVRDGRDMSTGHSSQKDMDELPTWQMLWKDEDESLLRQAEEAEAARQAALAPPAQEGGPGEQPAGQRRLQVRDAGRRKRLKTKRKNGTI